MKPKPVTPAAISGRPRTFLRTAPGGVVIHCRFKERRRGRSLHERGKAAGRS